MLFVACDWCTLLCWESAEYEESRKPACFFVCLFRLFFFFRVFFFFSYDRLAVHAWIINWKDAFLAQIWRRKQSFGMSGGFWIFCLFVEMVGFWYQKDLCPWAIVLNESILQWMKQQSARGTTHLKAVTNLVWCHPPSVIIRVAGYPVQGFYWSEYSRPLVSSPLRVRKSRVTHKVWRTNKNTTLQTQSF